MIIEQSREDFRHGLEALTFLCEGKVYVCAGEKTQLKTLKVDGVEVALFAGPHPAGNAGTHMHFLAPAGHKRVNWWIDAQDVMAMGRLLLQGELSVDRIVALAGPQVKSPRLLKTRLGADLTELTRDQLKEGECRVISGSVLQGRKVCQRFGHLGRFARQVTVVAEGRERELLGWHSPGMDKFSTKPIYLSRLFGRDKKFHLTTTTNGSHRSMVPIGMYEKVMPLDILPTQLLRALCSGDLESAQDLGALELDEEDLALCTFVDPGKEDYGPILRRNLQMIEEEG